MIRSKPKPKRFIRWQCIGRKLRSTALIIHQYGWNSMLNIHIETTPLDLDVEQSIESWKTLSDPSAK
jgi:hypothetical protein